MINTMYLSILSNRFRWVYCQLESLRHCLPASVRHILGELSKTLDETYEQILRDINEANREHAHRLLQCLTVAIRPLRVKELAEVLAVDFDAARLGGIPTVNTNWRWDDQQQAILSTCSSLIALVDHGGSQVVQFSHFSVKEFLTSERLAHPKRDVSRYHIPLHSAHATLAQACLAVLLRLDDRLNLNELPLSQYAANYWGDHVRFESVSSSIQNAIEYFLDCDKPHWNAWCRIRSDRRRVIPFTADLEVPLFYAAFCGLYDIAQHFITKYPHHVNPKSEAEPKPTPLHAALIGKRFHVAQLLYDHGADVNTPTDHSKWTLLHHACHDVFENVIPSIEIVRWLLTHRARVNARDSSGNTPLHFAAMFGHLDIVQILIRNKAKIDARGSYGETPLFLAAGMGHVEIVRTLIEHKAKVNARGRGADPPLYIPVQWGHLDMAWMLTRHRVNVNAKNLWGKTPLHAVVANGRSSDIAQMLLEHRANINAKDNENKTPLQVAVSKEKVDIVRVLLKYNANIDAKYEEGKTLLHAVIEDSGNLDIVRMLLAHNASVDAKCKWGDTPLHVAVHRRKPNMARMLIEHNANVNAKDEWGLTPLHMAATGVGESEIARMLIKHNANVDAQDKWGSTPLHWATIWKNLDYARILLENNANANVRESPTGTASGRRSTRWHKLSALSKGYSKRSRSLLEQPANPEDKLGKTPLDMALEARFDELVELLREHGAK
jgi:ankyrin repeat protein